MGVVAFSAFFTGLAGGLTALQLISIQPGSMFSPNWSTDMLIMTTLGGFSTLLGPVAGAVIIVALQQLLQDFLTVHVLIKAILLIFVIRFMPSGVVPQLSKLTRLFCSWTAWGQTKKEGIEDDEEPTAHRTGK
jgi:branched-chain amino acid transport system permease protein